ncbi:2-Hydroxyacid oxidase 2-like [Ptychodera flava]|uniref:2-Hydroxyacid oxidase 2-like n=1 Tax=Ptychodera flava TaxID=63121 RepID=UPI00396A535B
MTKEEQVYVFLQREKLTPDKHDGLPDSVTSTIMESRVWSAAWSAVKFVACVSVGIGFALTAIYVYKRRRKLFQKYKGMSDIEDFEREARRKLPRFTYALIAHGTGDKATVEENIAAFQRYNIRKRIMNDFPDLSTTIQDHYVELPVGIGPSMYRSWLWDEGDLCVSKAAGFLNICEIVPMLSDYSLEEIIESTQNSDAMKWFQIYICDDGFHETLVRRAEKAGYQGIVVASGGYGYEDESEGGEWTLAINNILDKLTAVRLGNFDDISPAKAFQKHGIRPTTWKDVKRLKSFTNLPMILMDIVTPKEAKMAMDHDVQGLIVSNEGGKTVDSLHGTLDILPEIVSTVENNTEVYVYGGVRSGSDVMKALGLGARACFLGRPVLYGLCYQGEEGVIQVLSLLKNELAKCMSNTGCTSVDEIGSFCVVRSSSFHEDN